ncbi:MAG TPA: hypothetical protein PKA53_10395, partial [Sphingobacterium sp.]|nr:hypothetical protein [Sphingobacterium sp.]
MTRLFYLIFVGILVLQSCSPSKKAEVGKDNYFVDRNILWFDATANFDRFCDRDSIVFYLQKSKDVGVTDIVVDVKPITGEVLYPS